MPLLIYAGENLRDKAKQKGGADPLPPPPDFSLDQSRAFTHVDGQARYFDNDVVDNILSPIFERRSATELRHPQLNRLGQIWAITPLAPGQLSAAEVVQRAHRNHQPILGSLSLVLLQNGYTGPALLIVGPPGLERAAVHVPGNPWAIIAPTRSYEAPYVKAPAPAVPAPPDLVGALHKQQNGAAHVNGVANGAPKAEEPTAQDGAKE